MSKYTTEVRYICENSAGVINSVGEKDVETVIAKAYPSVFWDSLELFDDDYKSVLFPKILLHYYTREIGYETVGLWKLKLNTRLKEILPYYNELYKSALLDFNPFYDVDITRDHKGKGDSHSAGESNTKGSGTSLDKYSDTPQGTVKNLENGSYLTSASKNENNNETSGNTKTTINNTDEWIEHVKGKQGGATYSKLLKEYRTTIINIDMMIIKDLSDLFMNIW